MAKFKLGDRISCTEKTDPGLAHLDPVRNGTINLVSIDHYGIDWDDTTTVFDYVGYHWQCNIDDRYAISPKQIRHNKLSKIINNG